MRVANRLRVVAFSVAAMGVVSSQELHAQATSGTAAEDVHTIDLPTVLRLARAENLDVQIVRERLNEAKANHASALTKFLPWISVGAAFRRHEGRTQAVDGTLLDVDKQSISYGPTVTAQVDIGDAIFSTLASKQIIAASSAAATAQEQDSTLYAASGYFDLLSANALVQVAEEALKTSAQYEQQIKGAVTAGVAFKGDELRVLTQTERYRAGLNQARQQRRLASATLAETLHLDPAIELAPQEDELLPLSLVDANTSIDALMTRALTSRVELEQSRALADVARAAKNSAIYGPLIPSLGAQAFFGEFGGGQGSSDGNFASSEDIYVGLNWRIGPGGLFDVSRINASKSRLSIAELNVEKIRNSIRRQVVESHARVQSALEQMTASRSGLTAATETLRLTRERKQLGVGVVLEDIQAQQELVRVRTDYLSAVAQFNKAQYELSRAVGDL